MSALTRLQRLAAAMLLVLVAVPIATAAGTSAATRHDAAGNGGGGARVPVETLPNSTGLAARNPTTSSGDRHAVSREVTVSPASVGAPGGRLAVLSRGKWIQLRNGGTLNLAGGLAAEVFVDPYPPARTQMWIDLHLIRSATRHPVTNAKVSMSYDMRSHTMGGFSARAKHTGDGHYVLTATYAMYGDWGHRLRIESGAAAYEIDLGVEALPGV